MVQTFPLWTVQMEKDERMEKKSKEYVISLSYLTMGSTDYEIIKLKEDTIWLKNPRRSQNRYTKVNKIIKLIKVK